MTGLSIDGDAPSWLNNGYALNSLNARLDRAVADAASTAVLATERNWYGPASAAFSASWAAQHASYLELLDLIRRAASAIAAYGQALDDNQARARVLEYTWCGAGLIIGPDGFMALPIAAAAISPEARLPLDRALADATRDVEQLSNSTAEAAVALAMALTPVAVLLEEFGLAAFETASIARYGREVGDDVAGSFKDIGGDAAAVLGIAFDATKKLGNTKAWQQFGEEAGEVTGVAGFDYALAQTAVGARHQGLEESIEDHAGAIVSSVPKVAFFSTEGCEMVVDALTGGAVLAGAPEVIAVIGVGVAAAVIAAGVGAVVQTVVDHNRAKINHLIRDGGAKVDHLVHDVASIF